MNFGIEFELVLCDKNTLQYDNTLIYDKKLKE